MRFDSRQRQSACHRENNFLRRRTPLHWSVACTFLQYGRRRTVRSFRAIVVGVNPSASCLAVSRRDVFDIAGCEVQQIHLVEWIVLAFKSNLPNARQELLFNRRLFLGRHFISTHVRTIEDLRVGLFEFGETKQDQ